MRNISLNYERKLFRENTNQKNIKLDKLVLKIEIKWWRRNLFFFGDLLTYMIFDNLRNIY